MGPRVLVLAPRLDLGGAEVHLSRVLPRLRNAGLDVSLFTITRGGSLEQRFVEAGISVIGPEAFGSRTMRTLRAVHVLRGELRRSPPHILHSFLPEPYLVGSLASAGIGGMARIMSRRSLSHYQHHNPLVARIERRLHCRMEALIANSTAVATQLVDECGQPDKVGIIHNGVELPPVPTSEYCDARRLELGIPADTFVIAVIANLIAYKGHDDLLEALAQARNRMNGPWRLMLIGRDDGIGAALKSKAEFLGIAANILWLGERSDSQALLAAADLAVLPSHQEGFSNSLIEKMAHALPVVATQVGGNCDAVIDGESGLLVPIRDPSALGAAIARLYGDAGMREQMGAAGRRRVERFFSLDACVHRYLNLYRGIIANLAAPVARLIDSPDAAHAAA